jgi:hypothetical protein
LIAVVTGLVELGLASAEKAGANAVKVTKPVINVGSKAV